MTPADNRARIQHEDKGTLSLPARTRTFIIGDIAALLDSADVEMKQMGAKLQREVNDWYARSRAPRTRQ